MNAPIELPGFSSGFGQVTYLIRNSLYVNLTNRCNLDCVFCPRLDHCEVQGYTLKLSREPGFDQVVASMGDLTPYDELVFCGYGESTLRLKLLLQICDEVRAKFPKTPIRLNTNGLANLVYKRNILPDLSGRIDVVSVSLNAADAATYARICPSKHGEAAYPAVKDFIREAKRHIPRVIATVVGLPEIDEAACRKIAEDELGAEYRYRPADVLG